MKKRSLIFSKITNCDFGSRWKKWSCFIIPNCIQNHQISWTKLMKICWFKLSRRKKDKKKEECNSRFSFSFLSSCLFWFNLRHGQISVFEVLFLVCSENQRLPRMNEQLSQFLNFRFFRTREERRSNISF